jgi:hypothetical protein
MSSAKSGKRTARPAESTARAVGEALPLKTPLGPTFGAAARDKRQANDATRRT